MTTTHLVSNQTYDETEVWCGADYFAEQPKGGPFTWPTHDPEKCDCKECLHALMNYAARGGRRLVELWGGTP